MASVARTMQSSPPRLEDRVFGILVARYMIGRLGIDTARTADVEDGLSRGFLYFGMQAAVTESGAFRSFGCGTPALDSGKN